MGFYIAFEKKSGGFYWHWGYMKRLCLGHLAFTYIPKFELDEAVKCKLSKEEIKLIDIILAEQIETSIDKLISGQGDKNKKPKGIL
jgi:hypothetical protein